MDQRTWGGAVRPTRVQGYGADMSVVSIVGARAIPVATFVEQCGAVW